MPSSSSTLGQPTILESNLQQRPFITATTVVFIHGAFVSSDCWQNWKTCFEAWGYRCLVLPWPGREAPAAAQRAQHPNARRAAQTLEEVLAFYATALRQMPEKPILIGHSMGGLLVQLLLSQQLGAVGVAVHSAPPRGIITTRWSFLKSNWGALNPLIPASRPYLLSLPEFQYAFTNGLPLATQRAAYEALVVPESRRVLRGVLGSTAALDYSRTHAPLLLLAGGHDHIVPAPLQRQTFHRYRRYSPAAVTYQEYPDRTHFVLGQEGWETQAAAAHQWLRQP